MLDHIQHIARVLARINSHAKAGRITETQRRRLNAWVIAEYSREDA